MAQLLDLFGFLTVILRGAALTGQSLALGGVAFLLLLAAPLRVELGEVGARIAKSTRRMIVWSGLALALVAVATTALQLSILIDSADLTLREAIGADFVIAAAVTAGAALLLAALARNPAGSPWWLTLIGLVILGASTASSHAASRLDGRLGLAALTALHQLGAAVWIGGIPYFLVALARCRDGRAWRRVGKRFSQMSMAAVAALFAAGLGLTYLFVGSWAALYGTAYGVMVGAKIALFAGLLFLGGMNFLLVERLRRDPATPVTRLKRFAEVELGIGLAVFFAAASLTSVPPAIDLTDDRVTWSEMVERLTPHWPRLSSPGHADLAIPALQARLDVEAAAKSAPSKPRAFVPGEGELPPRNAFDIAWSEYNHHWAGVFVLLIGLLALAERSGRAPWARHWPLLFIGLGGFLLIRSDPETWPLGDIGFLESFRDPEVVQHRLLVPLVAAFGLFEWRVRTGRATRPAAALVFPLITALGAGLLLTHSHQISNVKEQLLIEITHVPLALCGVAAAWARWLELRLDPPGNRIPGWIWPVCFALVGLLLLTYREA